MKKSSDRMNPWRIVPRPPRRLQPPKRERARAPTSPLVLRPSGHLRRRAPPQDQSKAPRRRSLRAYRRSPPYRHGLLPRLPSRLRSHRDLQCRLAPPEQLNLFRHRPRISPSHRHLSRRELLLYRRRRPHHAFPSAPRRARRQALPHPRHLEQKHQPPAQPRLQAATVAKRPCLLLLRHHPCAPPKCVVVVARRCKRAHLNQRL